MLEPTTITAIWGAASGTIGLVLSIYAVFRDRSYLSVDVSDGWLDGEDWGNGGCAYLGVTVANGGRRAAGISTVELVYFNLAEDALEFGPHRMRPAFWQRTSGVYERYPSGRQDHVIAEGSSSYLCVRIP